MNKNTYIINEVGIFDVGDVVRSSLIDDIEIYTSDKLKKQIKEILGSSYDVLIDKEYMIPAVTSPSTIIRVFRYLKRWITTFVGFNNKPLVVGFFHAKLNKIFILFDNIIHPEGIRTIALHETCHFLFNNFPSFIKKYKKLLIDYYKILLEDFPILSEKLSICENKSSIDKSKIERFIARIISFEIDKKSKRNITTYNFFKKYYLPFFKGSKKDIKCMDKTFFKISMFEIKDLMKLLHTLTMHAYLKLGIRDTAILKIFTMQEIYTPSEIICVMSELNEGKKYNADKHSILSFVKKIENRL